MELTVLPALWWLLLLLPIGWALHTTLVDRPRALRWASTALRALAVVLVVLALTRPQWLSTNDARHRVYVLDASHSIDPTAMVGALDAISAEANALGSVDTWSVFLLADGVRSTTLEQARELFTAWKEGRRNDDRFRSETRIADALRAVRLDMPADRQREIVLYSDGQATDGSLDAVIADLRAEHIALRFVPMAGLAVDEVAVESLIPSSPRAYRGEVLRLRTRIVANSANVARVRILRDGVVAAERTVNLTEAGSRDVDMDLTMPAAGDLTWQAEVLAERDHFLVNNQASTTVHVRGEPRILILHEQTDEMRPFAQALREQGYAVEVRGRFGLPERLDEMLAFDAVVFAKLPATRLSTAQMTLVKRYVTDFGGGVVMMGSDESFGIGGYYQTPIEDVLPLTSRYEKEKEKPSLSMVLVIDKSGSMDGQPIMLARQAAKATVDVLSSRDRIGVVAFDHSAYLASPLRSASEATAVKMAIDSIGADGGTALFPGMQLAFQELQRAPSKIKHVIILSDGQSEPADFIGMTQTMARLGITVSTVALGDGADQQLLGAIADAGGGRSYVTMDPTTVPQIFTKETMEASSTAIKEDLFGAVQTGDHPLLVGYRGQDLPFILGYVMTEAKPTAQVLLSVETGDPLLAIGRYGLGMGLAYTADLTERWGPEWLAWGDCGRFWAQALRPILRKADSRGIQLTQQADELEWSLAITRTDDDGMPVNGIDWDVLAVDDQGRAIAATIDEVGIGRYQATIATGNHTRVSLRLHDRGHDRQVVLHHQRPYPAEYRLDRHIPEILTSNETAFDPVRSRHPLALWLILLALASAFAGILLRRI